MRVVAIVQARMGSTRLPGKVLMPLAGTPVVQLVLQRLQRARQVHAVAVATSALRADDVLVDAVRCVPGVAVVRGSELDVLDRYVRAARHLGADAVVRVTSDCPLLDPEVVDEVVAALLDPPVDYASNTQLRTYPRGLDVEAFTRAALEEAGREARDPFEREHVTPFLWRRPARYSIRQTRCDGDYGAKRWTLDTPEDFELLRRIFDALGPRAVTATWRDALELVARHPDWERLNAHIEQKVR